MRYYGKGRLAYLGIHALVRSQYEVGRLWRLILFMCDNIRLPPIILDLILLVMTLYKAVQFHRMANNETTVLMRVFTRDQIMYFLAYAHFFSPSVFSDLNACSLNSTLLVGTINMILYADPNTTQLTTVAVNFATAAPCIFGSRMLLNLKEVGGRTVMTDSGPAKMTELSSVVFDSTI